jgi:REP element-mobilizing transposase RayT
MAKYSGPERKLPRARGFDYTSPGPYFVTICAEDRALRFGEVVDHCMMLNAAGEMVHGAWQEMAGRYPGLVLDAFVVMPNHMHGILILPGVGQRSPAVSLSNMIGWFKVVTTRRYIKGVHDEGWSPFDGRLWQHSFHDRIVRNDAEMERIWTYIANNPALWMEDMFYEE